ncbi:stearoyl-CoA desaturase 2-like [Chionomys nivalis]|uniref:stearoyl-CoA desaturase 2-like n=1 Tax=Chionomys nivalis TaxID=269649 RepID=UPI002592A8FE|nr:stearoyl-CoA desaturase 2-like [Chionomys nivalis]
MALLHLGALYGITLIPSCKLYTWFFGNLQTTLWTSPPSRQGWFAWEEEETGSSTTQVLRCLAPLLHNDVYEWVRDHRAYHKFTETHADPHNSRRGFFFSHMGWLLVRKHPAVKEKGRKLDMSDLKAEKLVMFQRRYYEPGLLLMFLVLPTLVPWYCWGEGFHNYHHAFPYDYSASEYRWHVNFTTFFIDCMAALGLAYDQNRVSKARIKSIGDGSCEGFHNYHHAFPYDYSASEYRWHVNFTTFFIDCMAALGLAYDQKRVSKATVLASIKKRTRAGNYKKG